MCSKSNLYIGNESINFYNKFGKCNLIVFYNVEDECVLWRVVLD